MATDNELIATKLLTMLKEKYPSLNISESMVSEYSWTPGYLNPGVQRATDVWTPGVSILMHELISSPLPSACVSAGCC